MSVPSFLLITDRKQAARPLEEVVEAALAGGCRWVMVREKDLPTALLRPVLEGVLARARAYGAAVSVNGDYAAASLCGAEGVHLPAGGPIAAVRRVMGQGRLIGASTHTLEEAEAAATAGANYVTLSPVFETLSKPGYGPALGLGGLGAVAARLPIPVLALGGVDAANAAGCLRAGAAGVAVMGEVMRAEDPRSAVEQILTALAGA